LTRAEKSQLFWAARPLVRFYQTWLSWAPWILLLCAVCLQIRAGLILLPADLVEADPPAHFTTGVMVHDFLRQPSLQPLPFAQCFYVHYPKVAFGHWPPVFYLLEAAWFFLFGARIVAARFLCACIAGACALALYRRSRESWGSWYALACAAVFLALPLVQKQAWRVMSDLLLAFFVFLALGSLSQYLDTEKRSQSLRFTAWSCLAILTKGTGWLLLLLLAIGPLVTRRTKLYFTWNYWLTVMLICIVSAPFYVLMSALNFGYPTSMQGRIYRLTVILGGLTAIHYVAGGLLLIIIAAVLGRFWPRKEPAPRTVLVIVMSLWVVSQVLLINLLPLTSELERFYIPSLAPIVFLISGAIVKLDRWLASRGVPYGRDFAALLCIGALAGSGAAHLGSTSAFSSAIAAIPVTGERIIILVESDPGGEGAMIAARLEQDWNRSSYILRSSKVLSTSLWSGGGYSLTYHDPAEVRAALDRNSVEYAVLDRSATASPSAELLETTLRDPASGWALAARTRVAFRRRLGDVLIYRRESAPDRARTPTSTQLGPERGFQTVTCGPTERTN
jgi:hypothetical protein